MTSNTHYVCRPCRQVFKGTSKCPHCGEPMVNYGKKFHAPRKTDDRGWKLVDAWLAGLTWRDPIAERARWKMRRGVKRRQGGRIAPKGRWWV